MFIVLEVSVPEVDSIFARQVVGHAQLLSRECALSAISLEQCPCLFLHTDTHRFLFFASLLDTLLFNLSRMEEVIINLYLI